MKNSLTVSLRLAKLTEQVPGQACRDYTKRNTILRPDKAKQKRFCFLIYRHMLFVVVVWLVFGFWFPTPTPKTGFLCIALAVLEFTL